MKVKMYICIVAMLLASRYNYAHRPNNHVDQPFILNELVIYIDKTDHTLILKHNQDTFKLYHCVFGRNPINDKKMEGDFCTPEGTFHVKSKFVHERWSRFIWIDYPTTDSWHKFELNHINRKIPASATIGGDIGIHGVPSGKDQWIDNEYNWTHGCISLKNEDVIELYKIVQVGTQIIITK